MVPIPPFYRIFFLYIDPVFCLCGIYLAFFDTRSFIAGGTPSVLSSTLLPTSATALSPQLDFLVHAQGAYLLGIFVVQTVLLRQAINEPRDVGLKMWKIVQAAILMIDLGLVYTSYTYDPKALLNVKAWGSGDWTNNGVLGTVITIRTAFLLGVE